ncbi:exonuclease domain-containing protein [Ectothiorhodospira shaposhnikovii]|uniref:3'-5' exonuclease n=1 Tax=Ectothiorhodospira shaposhnikovii TaxID=1054 RepID=UPI001EE84039|nr:3'-5' exonuclease [Ectothiorhodospira shaposhnikovii]
MIDTETTGLHQEKGDRIIEIALVEYDLETAKQVDQYVQRIHPLRSIDPKAQEVHGIGIEDLVGCPTWEKVAPEVHARLSRLDLLIAHNMGFDGPFIGLELLRVGMTPPALQSFCTMESARWATPMGKLPTLKELCFALSVPYDESAAHAALYDVQKTAECLFRGLARGFYTIETTNDEGRKAA